MNFTTPFKFYERFFPKYKKKMPKMEIPGIMKTFAYEKNHSQADPL